MSTNQAISVEGDRQKLWQPQRGLNKVVEQVVKLTFLIFALISVATTIGIVLSISYETLEFFKEIPITRFLTETEWSPTFANKKFGIIVLVCGTIVTTAISIGIALPVGLLAAICLSEYAPEKLRRILKPALEILAGVPTVVYGYFALLFVTPILKGFIPGLETFNALSAGLVMGVSIIPLVASLSEDAIYAVPNALRQGSYALGATKRETIMSVVLPSALSGIVASFILAISRAIGETMIVTIAAGQNPQLTVNPFVKVQTMTAYIVQVSKGDTPAGSLVYKTLFAVGAALFFMTLVLNILSFWFVRKFRQKYD
ncbi:phosphate ABC transporter permease subunit PstC [Merismopedia glauca]|uniref:Phosphate transport system permease protein n=1 Tax=Merismopedia glauca CCAP 1448/3 TaxID=1296344 RepID=A0A2T1C569_9CYAN|nr:phosphate ABC transporter permease subunit PstC [Merismopedia glauca]PSB03409.1 phosphate ABC transporter permease subunit PstC [Merismopedia glauca CCAP 1448/3]